MLLFRITEYVRYLLTAHHRKGHGIHSPFVYDVVSRVIRNKTDETVVRLIEDRRKMLLKDKRLVRVSDLGSGSVSRKNKNELRKVSDIARYSSLPPKYGSLLANLSVEFGSPGIIELGTSLGISTMYMAGAAPGCEIVTIEGSPEIAGLACQNFSDLKMNGIKMLSGSFRDKLGEAFSVVPEPGLVFIDGDHRRDSLLEYFGTIAERSPDRTVVVIDDIYLSQEMKEAWKAITMHKRVSVSLDLYRMGIVFFRKGLNKNNFIVLH